MRKKTKSMLVETKVRWGQIAGITNDVEARRRLNEAKRTFPGNEIELENMDGGIGDEYDEESYDMDGGDEFGEEPVDAAGDMGGYETDMSDDLDGEDDLEMGDDLGGMGGAEGGDTDLAVNLITAVSDAISSILGVETDVEMGYEDDLEMDDDLGGDIDMDDDGMGDDTSMGDDFGGSDVGGDDDLEDMDDEELMEELSNSINPSGGKVDYAGKDHKLKDEKDHLKNSINERYVNALAESVIRKLAQYSKRNKKPVQTKKPVAKKPVQRKK